MTEQNEKVVNFMYPHGWFLQAQSHYCASHTQYSILLVPEYY